MEPAISQNFSMFPTLQLLNPSAIHAHLGYVKNDVCFGQASHVGVVTPQLHNSGTLRSGKGTRNYCQCQRALILWFVSWSRWIFLRDRRVEHSPINRYTGEGIARIIIHHPLWKSHVQVYGFDNSPPRDYFQFYNVCQKPLFMRERPQLLLLTYLLTYGTEIFLRSCQLCSPSRTPQHFMEQYRVHKSPPLIPILSHIHPIHYIPSYLSKIHFNIVHPPTSHQYPIYIPLLPHQPKTRS
jgi:hypothetical protein